MSWSGKLDETLALWHFLIGTLRDYRKGKRINDQLLVFLILFSSPTSFLGEIGQKWSGVQRKHFPLGSFFVGLSKIYFPLFSVISFMLCYSSMHFLNWVWETQCSCSCTSHLTIMHFAFRDRLGNMLQFAVLDQIGKRWKLAFLLLKSSWWPVLVGSEVRNLAAIVLLLERDVLEFSKPHLCIPWSKCRVWAEAPTLNKTCVYSVFMDTYNPEIINPLFSCALFSGKC